MHLKLQRENPHWFIIMLYSLWHMSHVTNDSSVTSNAKYCLYCIFVGSIGSFKSLCWIEFDICTDFQYIAYLNFVAKIYNYNYWNKQIESYLVLNSWNVFLPSILWTVGRIARNSFVVGSSIGLNGVVMAKWISYWIRTFIRFRKYWIWPHGFNVM